MSDRVGFVDAVLAAPAGVAWLAMLELEFAMFVRKPNPTTQIGRRFVSNPDRDLRRYATASRHPTVSSRRV